MILNYEQSISPAQVHFPHFKPTKEILAAAKPFEFKKPKKAEFGGGYGFEKRDRATKGKRRSNKARVQN